MKKMISLILCLLLLTAIGCSKQLPTLGEVSQHGLEWTRSKCQGYTLEDFKKAWGNSEDKWESYGELKEEGHLWFADENENVAIIIYFNDKNEFRTMAICENATNNINGIAVVK